MKFIFINGDKKKEIYMSPFLKQVPSYLKNVSAIFDNKIITTDNIKEYGKLIINYTNQFTYKKADLPFDDDAFDIIGMNYELISLMIDNLRFFYEANLFVYFEKNMKALIYIMNDIVNTPFRHNIEDIESLNEAIHIMEDWCNIYYPMNGWYSAAFDKYIGNDIYSLLHDIGNTFYTMGVEEYTGYWEY